MSSFSACEIWEFAFVFFCIQHVIIHFSYFNSVKIHYLFLPKLFLKYLNLSLLLIVYIYNVLQTKMTATADHYESGSGDQHLSDTDVNTSSDVTTRTIQTNGLLSKASTFHRNIPILSWLDALEKDFDKAFVDLDLLLGDFDSDQVDFIFRTKNNKLFFEIK